MSELNPVRIAVIGAGAMGRNHIRFVTEEPEAELVAIADAFEGARATAEAAGVPCAVIVDAGKTEFHGVPTKTCAAVGPHSSTRRIWNPAATRALR